MKEPNVVAMEARPEAALPESSKLLITMATKLREDTARRFEARAVSAGMSPSQLLRLILDTVDIILDDWDPRVNIKFYLTGLNVHHEQLNLFFSADQGKARSKR